MIQRSDTPLENTARSWISSLLFQTGGVFAALLLLMVVTDGYPGAWLFSLSIITSVLCIAGAEFRRLKRLDRGETSIRNRQSVDLLLSYGTGVRDFSGQDLRGESFEGTDLSGANFSLSNIQGTSFKGANLQGASFVGAKAGIQKYGATGLAAVSFLLSAISGAFSIVVSNAISPIFYAQQIESQLSGYATVVILISFLATTFRRSLVAGTVVVTILSAITVSTLGTDAGAGVVVVTALVSEAIAVASAILAAGTIAGVVAVSIAATIVVIEAKTALVAALIVLLGAYIGWHALQRTDRKSWVWSAAVSISAIGGTSFYGANIADADFSRASLKNTDLRVSSLFHSNFHLARNLEQARTESTILSDPTIRELVVTRNGNSKSYVGHDMKGANLTGADLRNADLTEADISHALLESASLKGARLLRTQSLGTNFRQADLTGACLEGWNINIATVFDGIKCDYFYLLNGFRGRRPFIGTFSTSLHSGVEEISKQREQSDTLLLLKSQEEILTTRFREEFDKSAFLIKKLREQLESQILEAGVGDREKLLNLVEQLQGLASYNSELSDIEDDLADCFYASNWLDYNKQTLAQYAVRRTFDSINASIELPQLGVPTNQEDLRNRFASDVSVYLDWLSKYMKEGAVPKDFNKNWVHLDLPPQIYKDAFMKIRDEILDPEAIALEVNALEMLATYINRFLIYEDNGLDLYRAYA